MKGIIIEYTIDNEAWSDEDYELEQNIVKEFIITGEMIKDLIQNYIKLEPGDYVDNITRINKEG